MPGFTFTTHFSKARLIAAFVVAAMLSACAPDGELDLAAPSQVPVATALAAAPGDVPAQTYLSSASAAVAPSASRARSARSTRAPSSRPQAEQTYYIEFRARSAASYGHTFASVGKLDGNDRILTSEIVGLHPATDSPVPWMIGHLIPVPSETGASDGDLEEQYWTARYRIRMNKERFDDLMTFIRAHQASSPAWHAVFYNCNSFIADIARHMGLKAPGNTMLFPKEFIDELATLNGA